MSRKILNIYEANTYLSKLVDELAAGKDIVIAKAGVPKARLVALRPHRQPGGARIRIAGAGGVRRRGDGRLSPRPQG